MVTPYNPFLLSHQNTKRAREENQRQFNEQMAVQKQARDTELGGNLARGILSATPENKGQSYQQALEVARNNGLDLQGMPTQYTKQADDYLQQLSAMSPAEDRSLTAPSSVREYDRFQTLSPDEQKTFMALKRADKTVDIGGEIVSLDPITGEVDKTIKKGLTPENQQAYNISLQKMAGSQGIPNPVQQQPTKTTQQYKEVAQNIAQDVINETPEAGEQIITSEEQRVDPENPFIYGSPAWQKQQERLDKNFKEEKQGNKKISEGKKRANVAMGEIAKAIDILNTSEDKTIAGKEYRLSEAIFGKTEEGKDVSWSDALYGDDRFMLSEMIKSLQGNIAVSELLNIKEQGSGLGQVPHRQMLMLASLQGALKQGMPKDLLKKSLERQDTLYTALSEGRALSEEELNNVRGAFTQNQITGFSSQYPSYAKGRGLTPEQTKNTSFDFGETQEPSNQSAVDLWESL